MALRSQRQLLSPWERPGEGFRLKAENKETPAPVTREGLRKKCPGSTLLIKAVDADESSKSLPEANADSPLSSFFKVVELDHFKSGQKETPGPLNRTRLRKGSRGQQRQAVLAVRQSQTFCIRFRTASMERGSR